MNQDQNNQPTLNELIKAETDKEIENNRRNFRPQHDERTEEERAKALESERKSSEFRTAIEMHFNKILNNQNNNISLKHLLMIPSHLACNPVLRHNATMAAILAHREMTKEDHDQIINALHEHTYYPDNLRLLRKMHSDFKERITLSECYWLMCLASFLNVVRSDFNYSMNKVLGENIKFEEVDFNKSLLFVFAEEIHMLLPAAVAQYKDIEALLDRI